MITLDNKRLHDWIKQKDVLVAEGRAITGEIEKIEKKAKRFEIMEKRITGKILPPKEMTDKGDELVKQLTKMQNELAKLADSINKAKLEAVPVKIRDEHLQLLKDKEILERDRNKIALKVQKIKDRIIPVIQKEAKEHICATRLVSIDIGRFDDIETAQAKDGKVVIKTFNHFDDFSSKFK